jgi:hypothetical protein
MAARLGKGITMSVVHLPRQTSFKLPVDIALFSGSSQLTGVAADLSMRLICLDNGYTLDQTDGVFRTSPAIPAFTMSPYTDYPYDYFTVLTEASWPRGNYRALIRNSVTLAEYTYDFTLGLFVNRSLGYSVIYDGMSLNLSAWVEENGVAQTDYIALNNCNILNSTGTVIAGGTLGNNTVSTAGVFNFNPTVTLAATTNYIFTADAVVAGPATISNYTYTIRIGFARP